MTDRPFNPPSYDGGYGKLITFLFGDADMGGWCCSGEPEPQLPLQTLGVTV